MHRLVDHAWCRGCTPRVRACSGSLSRMHCSTWGLHMAGAGLACVKRNCSGLALRPRVLGPILRAVKTRRKPRCGQPSDVFTYALITDAETQP
eukprot:7384961-Prymnesium_polylepis.2